MERALELPDVMPVTFRINEWIRRLADARQFLFQSEIRSVRTQENITGKPLQESERARVIAGNSRMPRVPAELVSGNCGAPEKDDLMGPAVFLRRRRPG